MCFIRRINENAQKCNKSMVKVMFNAYIALQYGLLNECAYIFMRKHDMYAVGKCMHVKARVIMLSTEHPCISKIRAPAA